MTRFRSAQLQHIDSTVYNTLGICTSCTTCLQIPGTTRPIFLRFEALPRRSVHTCTMFSGSTSVLKGPLLGFRTLAQHLNCRFERRLTPLKQDSPRRASGVRRKPQFCFTFTSRTLFSLRKASTLIRVAITVVSIIIWWLSQDKESIPTAR